jgi:preprotein translocase subunit Sss1
MDSDLFVKGELKWGEKARVENFTTKTDSLSDPKRIVYTALVKVSGCGILHLGLFGYWTLCPTLYIPIGCFLFGKWTKPS